MEQSLYQIEDMVLKVRHDDSELYTYLHDEIEMHSSKKSLSPNTTMSIQLCSDLPELPQEAVLAGKWFEEGKETHELGSKKFIVIEGAAFIECDYEKYEVNIYYTKFDARVLVYARVAMKWLLIKKGESLGYAYVHGAVVRFKERNILFAGNSGSGKTSFLFRILKQGGKVITDDVLLVKERKLIPFVLNVSVRSDFDKRFGLTIKSQGGIRTKLSDITHLKQKDCYVDMEESVEGIDMLIFPQVWNSSVSKVSEVGCEEAKHLLYSIYEKEADWNAFTEPEDVVMQRYDVLLQGTTPALFYAGSAENEIEETFLNWMKGVNANCA